MPRTIKSPNAGSTIVNPIKISQGGTGKRSAAEALDALGGLPASLLGVPGGIARSTATGDLEPSSIAGLNLTEVGIDGPASIVQGETQEYFITTFDAFNDYLVTTAIGSVIRDRNVIRYTAPNQAGQGGFLINGRQVTLTVTAPVEAVVTTPTITNPSNGATSVSLSLILTAAPFSMTSGQETHASSDWQLSTTSDFSTLVVDHSNSTTDLTSWTPGNAMQYGTTYYARTRQRSSGGKVSAWSSTVSFSTRAAGLVGTEQSKLLAGSPYTNSYFGHGVSLSSDGNTALVSAHGKNDAFVSQGEVYVFVRANGLWTQQAKLNAGDPAANDLFGWSVSLSFDGNMALIGASGKTGTDSSQGVAYIFTRSGTTWTQQAKLVASDPAANDQFGYSVSLSGDGTTALIGAFYKTDRYSQQGVAYVFTRSGSSWSQQVRLVGDDSYAGDNFGRSVSLSGDGNTALIGAYHVTRGIESQEGAIYIFTRSGTTWSLQAKSIAPSPTSSGNFGMSTSLSSDGNVALVGAYTRADGNYRGVAYVFTRTGTTWTAQASLTPNDPDDSTYFGMSVSLSNDGNSAIVGAYNKRTTYYGQGTAYVFTRNGSSWTQKTKLLASDPVTNDYYGMGVGLSGDGNTALVGAYNKTGTYEGQGAAYVVV